MTTAVPPATNGSRSRSEFRGADRRSVFREMAHGVPGGEEQRALSKATGLSGNYVVPELLYDRVVAAARPRRVVAALAREIITDTGSTLTVPTAPTHGVGEWVAEGGLDAPSDEVFGQLELRAFKSRTSVIASEELETDAGVDLDAYLAEEFGGRLAALQEASFAVGSGVGQPQGFVPNVPAVTAGAGSTTAFTLTDVRSLYLALPSAYRATAAWVMHPDAFGSLASLTDSAGGLALPGLQQLDSPVLMGRPVLISAAMPAPGASAKSVAFGDFRAGYVVRRVRAIGVQRLGELYANQGQVGFRAIERVDGRVGLPDAIRVLQHSAT
jgi:HK97 family phage major capsid protein